MQVHDELPNSAKLWANGGQTEYTMLVRYDILTYNVNCEMSVDDEKDNGACINGLRFISVCACIWPV